MQPYGGVSISVTPDSLIGLKYLTACSITPRTLLLIIQGSMYRKVISTIVTIIIRIPVCEVQTAYQLTQKMLIHGIEIIHKIRDWIDAPDPSVNYIAAYNKVTEGTGRWFTGSQNFFKWKTSGGLLWLQGKGQFFRFHPLNARAQKFEAGSGKTFLRYAKKIDRRM